jgi:hypothetical protein
MKRSILFFALLACILYGCKKEKTDYKRLILGNWHYTQYADSNGVLQMTNDTLSLNFTTTGTVVLEWYAYPIWNPALFYVHYDVSESALFLDTPSIFSVAFCQSPKYDIVSLTRSKLHIKSECKWGELVFER